ncbi:MAG: hypothetical protein [Circular genetic element sp.]|nr:MAG: hypothetical protein [Circular genetic element sp.]
MNKSFGITIRPKEGVIADSMFETKILKAIQRYDYYHCVAEKTGIERHLHFQIWSNEEKRKGDIKKTFSRICEKEDWWDVDHKRYCIKDKCCYNDWFDGYCIGNESKTSDKSEILLDNIPAISGNYYPSEEDQQKWKDESKAIDKTFHNLAVRWREKYSKPPSGLADVALFFNNLMFKDKVIKVIEDKRRRIQRVECLYFYLVSNACIKHSMTIGEYDIHQMKLEISSDMSNV